MALIDDVLKLLEINRERRKWDGWLDDKETWTLVNKISKDEKFYPIFDWELTADFFSYVFEELKIPEKKQFTQKDAEEFLDLLYKNLEVNVKDYWIVLPLNRSSLEQSIQLNDNLWIITGTPEEKKETLRLMIGLEPKESLFRFEHTEKSRSPEFFSYPLLIKKMCHQFNVVKKSSEFWSYYAVSMLKVVYYAFIYPDNKLGILSFLGVSGEEERPNQHVVIQCIGSNWRHLPLRYDYACNFKLDWLASSEYQDKFLDLLKLLNRNEFNDELTHRFLRAIRFFAKGIDVKSNHSFFEEDSDAILYLNIAIESVLLNNQEEGNKSRKIKGRLSRLGQLNGTDIESTKKIIGKMIQARGGYVHEGLEYYSKFQRDNFGNRTKEELDDLDLFKKIIAAFLADSYQHVGRCKIDAEKQKKELFDVWTERLSNK